MPGILTRLHCTRPLIVTDPFMVQQGPPTQLTDPLGDAGIECADVLRHRAGSDHATSSRRASAAYRAGNHDSLISFGGGSPIDTAKAMSMLVANGGHLRDYKVPNPIPKAGPPLIAIPTTAGTGSEVTRFTVITDTESDEKMLIAGRRCCRRRRSSTTS